MKAVSTRRPRKQEPKVRSCNYAYFVEVNGQRSLVCKSAFISLLGISAKRVRRLAALLSEGKSPHENRGKSIGSRVRAITGDVIEKIKTHIESFEVKMTHYANREIKYLKAGLNVKTMHLLFQNMFPEEKVTYQFYLKYFQENYSYRFGRPMKDVCGKCEELTAKIKSTVLNDNAKRVATAEKMVHIKRSQKFYKKIKEIEKLTKSRDDVEGICIDFMQNLPLPHIPVQEVFYMRQLWVFTFGIKSLKSGKSYFYVYHEGQAKKGPNEVCTLLSKYISEHIPQSCKELHIFSDSCPGQNRNNTVVRFLMSLVATNRFDKIMQYFPVRGHSFLPCDRDFGVIKRTIRDFDRIYSPLQYVQLIATSSKQGKFTVELMDDDFSVDFKTWWPRFFKKSVISRESLGRRLPKDKKITFSVSQFYEFIYDKSTPGAVCTRDFIDGLLSHHFNLKKVSVVILPCSNDKAYAGKCPINPKKIKDLQALLKYIPQDIGFYENIVNWPTTSADSEDDC